MLTARGCLVVLLCLALAVGTSSAMGPSDPYLADVGGGTQSHCGQNPAGNLICFILELLPNMPLGRGGGT